MTDHTILPGGDSEYRVFVPLTKMERQADGSLHVFGTVSSEDIDVEGEIVEYEAVKKAASDYMRWAAIREMHQESAVGTALAVTCHDDTKTADLLAKVIDADAIAKCEAGVYKGYSLGGKKLRRGLRKVGAQTVPTVSEILWIETSLVDRPANGRASFTLMKRDTTEDAIVEDELEKAAEADVPEVLRPLEERIAEQEAPLEKVADAEDKEEAEDDEDKPDDDKPDFLKAADADDLAKGGTAAEDLMTAAVAIDYVARLITCESATHGAASEQVAPLRVALQNLQKYAGMEAQEIGTPEDLAILDQRQAPMLLAAVTGDLAKRAMELRKGATVKDQGALDQLHDMVVAAGAHCSEPLEKAATPDTPGAAPDPAPTFDEDAYIQRTMDILRKAGTVITTQDFEAMKGEIVTLVTGVKEDLAKVAAMPAPGGPARYAVDPRRPQGDGREGPAVSADVLHKAAQAATDPKVREQLGILAAQQEILAQSGR